MMEPAQSFTARRSAAATLPTFQLPPPDHLPIPKFPYQPSSTQPPPVISSIPTPPHGVQSDFSPLASSVNSGSSGSSTGSYQTGFWPTPQSNTSYTFSTAPSMPATYASGQQSYGMGRPLYSPMGFANRTSNSPTASEGLPPPPYEINLPSFQNGMSGSQQQNLLTLAPQQHAQPQQHQQNISSMAQSPVTQAPQQSPMHAPENYGRQIPPPHNYYPASSTPQQSSFPAFSQQSPTQHSPSTNGPSSRISPISAHPQSSLAAPSGYHQHPYGAARYSLPAMSGHILSNIHSPGGQMSLVGGGMPLHYGQQQLSGPMYGHHSGQQQVQNDRPFKCDQCPQSFNRNHDLKRHKRIHLAVKPFPCVHCEKSFSRKDALKRHILVKGCGKASANASNTNGGSQSSGDKNDVMSDSTEDNNSPEMMKKEL